MAGQCRLSNVTKDYLATFHYILDNMIRGMTEARLTSSISRNFIVQMIPHHQAAIDMSRNILHYTTNIALQDIALDIVREQTKSIENMQEIECCCSRLENTQREVCLYQERVERIMQVMFSGMENACAGNQINADFIQEMIPHHKGAIAMSENALCYNICPELKPILQAIISSQKKGVMQMQRLLRCMRC